MNEITRVKGQKLQVEHQRKVILEDRRRTLRLLHLRQFDVGLLLRFFDAAFHVAHRFRVLIDLNPVLRSEFSVQAPQLLRN
jgi:hypothetical protein